MKSSLLGFVLLSLFAQNLPAQTPNAAEMTAESHHHLILKNQYVRVFNVELPANETIAMHWHHYDYAYVTIGAAEISNDVAGKAPVDVKLRDGETRFLPGPFAHSVRDLAKTPFRNITVELLRKQAAKKPSPEEDSRGLDILNGGTSDTLFLKDDARMSDVQLNPGGTLPKNSKAHARLIISVTDTMLHVAASGARPTMISMKPGDVHWFNSAAPVMNSGKGSARFICFDFE